MMRLFKRITAVLLTVLFMIVPPPVSAPANLQAPVHYLRITDSTMKGDSEYKLLLEWSKPFLSMNPDTSAGVDIKTGEDVRKTIHSPQGYRILYRNASTNETFKPVQFGSSFDAPVNLGADILNVELSLRLNPASVYEFKIEPYHIHKWTTYVGTDTNIREVYHEREAVIDTREEMRALFFTDMEITELESFSTSMTISWIAPKYNNQPLFERFRIFWKANDGTDSPIIPGQSLVYASPIIDTNSETTESDSYMLTQTSVGSGSIRYTCTFSSNDLRMGVEYSAIVEPLAAVSTPVSTSLWRYVDTQSPHKNPNPVQIKSTERVKYVFVHTDPSQREFRSSAFMQRLPLYVFEESPTQLRIYWDSRHIPLLGDRRIYIYETNPGERFGREIGVIGPAGNGINFVIISKPATEKWYFITLGEPQDELELNSGRRSYYAKYDPDALDFKPYSPDILELSPIAGNYINLFWTAFVRNAYNSDEKTVADMFGNPKFIDTDVVYDIFISDSIRVFEEDVEAEPIYRNIGIYGEERLRSARAYHYPPPRDNEWVWAYELPIGRYYDFYKDKMENSLKVNQLYYIKIVAKRGGHSQEAYGSVYLPGDAPTNPQMMAKPPLRVGAEPDMDTIYISWQTRWNEVYNDHDSPETGNMARSEGWYSNIAYDTARGLYEYVNTTQAGLKLYDLSNSDEYDEFIELYDHHLLPKRKIDVTGSDFQVHVVPFERMLQLGSSSDPIKAAEEFIESISAWQKLEVERGRDRYTDVPITSDFEGKPIQANTSYVVFFRPVDPDGRPASYPTFVSVVTPDRIPELEVRPTTPTLYIYRNPDRTTARSVSVYWERSPSLEYTLVYSDLISQYDDGGMRIDFADIEENGGIEIIDGNQCWVYEITDLFAMTEYYFWVRSEVRAPTNQKPPYSNWSNPISEITKDVDIPLPPQGLGLASRDLIDEYNAQFSTELMPIGADYMILQWMRDYNDTTNEATSTTKGDVVRLDLQVLPENLYLAKFGSLIMNREYYIRAKTIYTMLRTGSGIKVQHSYLVQIADNEDFIDALQIHIPALDPEPLLKRDMIRKESDWTSVLRLKTSTSSDDFDGEWDARMYPLPASDFEITYNPATGELKYRFRSMSIAEDGSYDNSVDQRFISRMIRERVYIYELDLTHYMGNRVQKRTLEIPYSIVRAMDEREVRLRFVADNMTMTIAPRGLLTAEANTLPDFDSLETAVLYSLHQNPEGMPGRMAGAEFASLPHKLMVTVATPTRKLHLTNLAQDLEVSMKLDARYIKNERNINTYYTDVNTAGWMPVNSVYNDVERTMAFTTRRVGTYSAIAGAMPVTASGRLSDTALTLMRRLSITDLYAINPYQPINASQFNNIVVAIVRNKPTFAINGSISAADHHALGQSGILVSGMELTREAGVHALVRLYELKTDASVQNFGTVVSTPYADIASAKEQYQVSLLKAVKLGFFNGLSTNPHGPLTINDAFEMFAYIIEDAGSFN